MATCTLCDLPTGTTPVTDDDVEGTFCCRGCLEVHRRTREGSDDAETAADREDAGASDRTDDASAVPDGAETAYLAVEGMHCASCETFLQSVATDADGVYDATASYVTETVRVDYDPDALSADAVSDRLTTAGYTARDRSESHRNADEGVKWRLAAGVVLGMWVMVPYVVLIYPVHFSLLYPDWMLAMLRDLLTRQSTQYFFYVLALFTAGVVGYTGRPILQGAYVSLRAGVPNVDLLVSLAVVSAYAYSVAAVLLGRLDVYFDVAVVIVVVVTAGSHYESTLKRRATERLTAVTATQVDEARRYENGTTETVSVDDLEPGDRVLVRDGDRVPVDGRVRDGTATVDEAVVTGESLPVGKTPGDEVVGGSVVTDGSAVVEVAEGAESSRDRITELLWSLQSADHGIQRLADRLAGVFVPGVVTLALVAAVGYLAVGAGVTEAVLVALTVLLVSCPCALGLATPLATAAGIRDALTAGVVVFDETVFERLRSVDTVVFDKTGTLTTETLIVTDAEAPSDALAAAAALERRTSHPVAEAMVNAFGGGSTGDSGERAAGRTVEPDGGDAARQATVDRDERTVERFESHATGVAGTVDGRDVLVGRPNLFDERGWTVPDTVRARATEARESGRLPVVVGRDGTAEGVVVLADEPRDGWAETVDALADRGVDVVVLTGDDERAARPFRDHPGVTDVFAGVPPEAKSETVRRLGREGTVAMVGDGTNDAPALANADLGVALGSGTAMAVDAADVAIVDDDLRGVETVFELATAARRRVRQNVGWALCYNAVAIPLALSGLLNPLFAAVAMASSSLLVVANSSRPLLE